MKTMKLGRGIFAALVAGTLGFGATQAFASPAAPAGTQWWCTAYEEQWCDDTCVEMGASHGECTYFGTLYCKCIYS